MAFLQSPLGVGLASGLLGGLFGGGGGGGTPAMPQEQRNLLTAQADALKRVQALLAQYGTPALQAYWQYAMNPQNTAAERAAYGQYEESLSPTYNQAYGNLLSDLSRRGLADSSYAAGGFSNLAAQKAGALSTFRLGQMQQRPAEAMSRLSGFGNLLAGITGQGTQVAGGYASPAAQYGQQAQYASTAAQQNQQYMNSLISNLFQSYGQNQAQRPPPVTYQQPPGSINYGMFPY